MAKLRMTITVQVDKDTTLRPGSVIEAREDDPHALSLVARGFASWVKAGGEEPEAIPLDRIIAAIGKLDPSNVKHFKAGKPELKALAEVLGVEVSADQRDQAWAALQG